MSADIAFACEKLGPDLWPDLRSLLQANHDEAVAEPGAPRLAIDHQRYEALERAGALRVFTAREDGRMVGYAAFLVSPSLNYLSTVIAFHVGMYLAPARRGLAGLRLVRHCDRALAAEGVTICRQAAKPDSPFGALLDAVGYHVAEVVHEKHLRDCA